MQFGIREALAQLRPFRLRLLDPVFTEYPMAGLKNGFDVIS